MINKYLFFLLLISLLPSCNTANQKSNFPKFTGRWKLHIVEVKNDSLSSWIARGGNNKNRKDFIIYDGLGGMGVHHVTENYEEYKFEGKGGLDTFYAIQIMKQYLTTTEIA